MPPTTASAYPGLRIELERPLAVFLPGETVTGVVTFKPASPANFNRVNLKLWGRCKTKIVRTQNNNRQTYRGRRTLVDTKQILCQRDVPTLEIHHAWPFAVTLPRGPEKARFRRDDFDSSTPHGFLATDDKTEHELPASVHTTDPRGFMSYTKAEGYVEYALTVEMRDHREPGKEMSTTLPITVKSRSTAQPIRDMKLVSRKSLMMFKTTRLLPEDEQPEGRREKMKYFFKPSEVPSYTCSLLVDIPTLIQLNHPEPLPLRICRLHTARSIENTTLNPSQDFPDVRITSVDIQLQRHTSCWAPSTFSHTTSDKSEKIELANRSFVSAGPEIDPRYSVPIVDEVDYVAAVNGNAASSSKGLDQQPYFNFPTRDFTASSARDLTVAGPSGSEQETEAIPPTYQEATAHPGPTDEPSAAPAAQSISPSTSKPPYLDLGALLAVHFTHHGASSSRNPRANRTVSLSPSFRTYHMFQRWELSGRIRVECAGESEEIRFQSAVRVLPECDGGVVALAK